MSVGRSKEARGRGGIGRGERGMRKTGRVGEREGSERRKREGE